MRPIFTIHAGEYLVAEYLEKNFKNPPVRVWVPSKDTGIDLLVTDMNCKHAVSLQVKFSKVHQQQKLNSLFGWWTIDEDKLQKSSADFWILVFPELNESAVISQFHYCVIKPATLLNVLKTIHGKSLPRENGKKVYDVYLQLFKNKLYEVRGMKDEDIAQRAFYPSREFTRYLNVWAPVQQQLSGGKSK